MERFEMRPAPGSFAPALITTSVAYGSLSVVLGAALIGALIAPGGGGWHALVFALMPDVAGALSIDPTLARGQLHPRAVPLYNLLHNLVWPIALGVVSVAWLGLPWLIAALTWALHISLDRMMGYGPRTKDGFQRGQDDRNRRSAPRYRHPDASAADP